MCSAVQHASSTIEPAPHSYLNGLGTFRAMAPERRDLTGREVVFLVAALQRAGVRCWLDGGWGVDALLGRQTRPHDDLDLVVVAEDVDPTLLDALAPLHFTIKEDRRPTRLVLRDHADRQVDVRPVARDAVGDTAVGEIEGRPVPCLRRPPAA